jgi:hypothetical protein
VSHRNHAHLSCGSTYAAPVSYNHYPRKSSCHGRQRAKHVRWPLRPLSVCCRVSDGICLCCCRLVGGAEVCRVLSARDQAIIYWQAQVRLLNYVMYWQTTYSLSLRASADKFKVKRLGGIPSCCLRSAVDQPCVSCCPAERMVRHADLLTVLAHLALQDSLGEAWCCNTAEPGNSCDCHSNGHNTRVCTLCLGCTGVACCH